MNVEKAVLDNITPALDELRRKRDHAVADVLAMNGEISRLETLSQLSGYLPEAECARHQNCGGGQHDGTCPRSK